MSERGLEMASPKILTPQQFEHYYKVTQHDTEMRKREGKLAKSTIIDTTAKIVKKQQYAVSYKQAQAFRRAEENIGRRPTSLKTIQTGQADWDFVKDRYRELRKAGLGGKAAGRVISEEFFYGSK